MVPNDDDLTTKMMTTKMMTNSDLEIWGDCLNRDGDDLTKDNWGGADVLTLGGIFSIGKANDPAQRVIIDPTSAPCPLHRGVIIDPTGRLSRNSGFPKFSWDATVLAAKYAYNTTIGIVTRGHNRCVTHSSSFFSLYCSSPAP